MPPFLSKRQLGRILFALGTACPPLRPGLARWGLRTQREWFQGVEPVAFSRRTGCRLKLASFSGNYLSFALFWRGLDYYEPLSMALALELGRSADQFIDAGANIGIYSLRLAAAHPALDVVSFEPHPRLYALLAANIRANGFTQVTAEPIALSDGEGVRPFYLNRSDMSASLEREFDGNQTGAVGVEVSSLDAYLRRRPVRGARLAIKVDVEGHEPAFFAGAEETLQRFRPDILAEAAVPYPARTIALLERHGYRFRQVTDQGLLPCAEPAPVLRDDLVFLNCLLTARPAAELAGWSEALRARAKSIDLRRTSKRADRRVLDRCRRGFVESAPPPAVRSLAALPGRWPGRQMR